MNQVYYTVTINGAEVESVENTEPKTMTNVRVFAGDKFKPAADASYRNLVWETFHIDHRLNVGTKVEKGKKIATINSLGPFFRISFDLIIHSYVNKISNVLQFEDLATGNHYIAVKYGFLYFMKYNFQSQLKPFRFKIKKWYNIIFELKSINRKVTCRID